ncbi:MAG: ribonuclease HII [Oscillospiraceae bacterium]|nr:ribonuclease HII [Oscillospiraceae bacterium]
MARTPFDFAALYAFDATKRTQHPVLCGVDEAGRGPLAGPVFAAAVILPSEVRFAGLRDSKKLSEAKREILFDEICEKAISFGIGAASPEEIDAYNILRATYLAMRRAVAALEITPDLILVDGNRIPDELPAETQSLIKGDDTSASVAAAAILAKVSRDRYMKHLAEKYPEYAFDQHKGYGTKLHYEKIAEQGISPVHRLSFLKKEIAAGIPVLEREGAK